MRQHRLASPKGSSAQLLALRAQCLQKGDAAMLLKLDDEIKAQLS
jgi:hypothetical protein